MKTYTYTMYIYNTISYIFVKDWRDSLANLKLHSPDAVSTAVLEHWKCKNTALYSQGMVGAVDTYDWCIMQLKINNNTHLFFVWSPVSQTLLAQSRSLNVLVRPYLLFQHTHSLSEMTIISFWFGIEHCCLRQHAIL